MNSAARPVELSTAEAARYHRHLQLPQFGPEGQARLKQSSVLVVGAGGLGNPLLSYLAAAGVGRLGIVDYDVVDESNLQRQVLFTVEDVGLRKVDVASRRVRALNPHVEVDTHHTLLSSSNAISILNTYDIIADGTDNFPSRYLLNDASVLLKKPLIYGSIFQFEGQVSVFNWKHPDGRIGPNYRDLYPIPPEPGTVPSCAEAGVIGALPGIIGSLQAIEVVKVAAGVGEPLSGRLFLFDALRFEARVLRFDRDPQNPLTGEHPTQSGLIDYEEFCGLRPAATGSKTLPSLTALELKAMMDRGMTFQLIDVREHYEYGIVNLGGDLIPLSSLDRSLKRIARDRPVVIHCKVGARSAVAVQALMARGFDNVMNLEGGIMAYIDKVDPTLPRY